MTWIKPVTRSLWNFVSKSGIVKRCSFWRERQRSNHRVLVWKNRKISALNPLLQYKTTPKRKTVEAMLVALFSTILTVTESSKKFIFPYSIYAMKTIKMLFKSSPVPQSSCKNLRFFGWFCFRLIPMILNQLKMGPRSNSKSSNQSRSLSVEHISTANTTEFSILTRNYAEYQVVAATLLNRDTQQILQSKKRSSIYKWIVSSLIAEPSTSIYLLDFGWIFYWDEPDKFPKEH